MTDIERFGEEISKFRIGDLVYNYSFNSAGNLFFKKDTDNFNESFLKVEVKNFEYDLNKFSSLYKLDFEEFRENPQSVNDSANISEDVIQSYKIQIDSLKMQISSSTSPNSDEVFKLRSDLKASRDTIVNLRISAGEGRTDEDFSDDFPYYSKNIK